MEELRLIYDSVIKASLDSIISINEKGTITLWNNAATKMFGYIDVEALGKPITKIIPKEYRRYHRYGMRRFLKTGKKKLIGKVVEIKGMRSDESLIPIELSISASKTNKGYIFTAIIRDISEKKSLKKYEEMAIKDSLTGVYNRNYFEEFASKEFERARRYRHYISVMMIDVDKFKMINDTYGHARGDLVLKAVARCLKENVRASDVVMRYGGDEFLVVLPEANSKDLKKTITKIKKKVEKSSKRLGMRVLISLSIGGYTMSPNKKKDVDEILREADARLYKDKGCGNDKLTTRRS